MNIEGEIKSRPHSIKTLIKFLRENPNVECVSNGQKMHLVFDKCDRDGIFWNTRAGKQHSYDRLNTVPGSNLEPGIEINDLFSFTIRKGEKKKVFYYE